MKNLLKKTQMVQKFIKDGDLKSAKKSLGKSKATIYRYVSRIESGEPLTDGRKFGNNRKYGRK